MNASRLIEHFDRISGAPDSISKLRKFILDLAVRGKLVEQRSSEEDAADMLRSIGPLEHIAGDDRPFELPSNWVWARFGELAEFSAGRTPPRQDTRYWNSGDFPWASIADMKDGEILISTKETVSEEAKTTIFRSEPAPVGTMLMSFKLTIGKIVRLGIPAFHNEAIISIRPRVEGIGDYIFKVLPFFARQGDTKDAIKGATLNRESLANITIPVPPLAEQHRIVAKVDELMGLCDRLEEARLEREAQRAKAEAGIFARVEQRLPENQSTATKDSELLLSSLAALVAGVGGLTRLRQSILTLAVRGDLVRQNSTEASSPSFGIADDLQANNRLHLRLPSGWAWARVEDVADARLGKMLDKAKNSGRAYRYLGNTNVHWFEIRTSRLKEIKLGASDGDKYLLHPGDVLVCEGGHGIGRAAIWRGELPEIAFQKALHRVRPGQRLQSDFFAYCIKVYFDSGVLQSYFTGVGIPHFTGQALAKLVFPLPPRQEQARIVERVTELMSLCHELDSWLATSQATSNRLLAALLHEALAIGARANGNRRSPIGRLRPSASKRTPISEHRRSHTSE